MLRQPSEAVERGRQLGDPRLQLLDWALLLKDRGLPAEKDLDQFGPGGSRSNSWRVMAATPAVMVSAFGPPGS